MPLRLLALLTLLAATSAAADEEPPREDAHAHHEAGQKFYDQGRYDEAIAEFEAAYRLKPHPNVLYNIAQAHERLLQYGQSVLWFERYLREAPADAEFRVIVENRLRVLRNLPARISVTSTPEHAQATVSGGGVEERGETPHVFKVPQGSYTITLTAPGWETEHHDVHADIGQPYFYQYRLKRSTAMLQVFSRPRGARVFLDNRLVGETPFADAVEVGKHLLLLEHPDYPWYREDLDVKQDQPLKREIKLTRPRRSGRTELVLASMIYGGAVGPLLVGAVSDFKGAGSNLYLLLGTSLGGIGLGFVGSFLATRDGIKDGHSSLIIGTGAWGSAIGAGLALGLDVPTQYVYALTLLGGGLGITTGVLVSRWSDTSPGDAAVFNSGGVWGTASGLLLAQAIFAHPTDVQLGWFMLGGTALGVTAATFAAWRVEISRGHMALVDLGGLAGGGLGFALGYVIGANSKEDNGVQVGARYSLGGLAVGILTAAILSRNYKGDLPPVEALVTHERGRWALSMPKPRLESALVPEGRTLRFTFDLARGSW